MRTITRAIGSGDRAIDKTVEHMIRLARRDARAPEIRALARALGGRTREAMNQYAFRAVVERIPYVTDPGRCLLVNGARLCIREDQDFLIAPIYTLTRRIVGGDCDDMATALASIVLAQGGRVGYRVLAWRRWEFTHVYTLLWTSERGWYPCDPVNKHVGYNWQKGPQLRVKDYRV